eukprot:353839-Chlamydomonas_euryale.AAC.58
MAIKFIFAQSQLHRLVCSSATAARACVKAPKYADAQAMETVLRHARASAWSLYICLRMKPTSLICSCSHIGRCLFCTKPMLDHMGHMKMPEHEVLRCRVGATRVGRCYREELMDQHA